MTNTPNGHQDRASRQSDAYSYRNLIVWKKAQDLAFEIIKLTRTARREPASDVLIRQVIRSASSVAANIAEGHGRYTPRAHANHLSIAKGSACETDSWLDLMERSNVITPEDEERLHRACLELIAMLTSRMRELERQPGYK